MTTSSQADYDMLDCMMKDVGRIGGECNTVSGPLRADRSYKFKIGSLVTCAQVPRSTWHDAVDMIHAADDLKCGSEHAGTTLLLRIPPHLSQHAA